MPFTQNLNHCMEQKGLTAYKLAQILSVSNQGVLNWCAGKAIPHPKTRVKIAEHFGITLAELDGDALPTLPADVAPDKKDIKKERPVQDGTLDPDKQAAWELLQKMDDDTLRRFINAAKAMLGE